MKTKILISLMALAFIFGACSDAIISDNSANGIMESDTQGPPQLKDQFDKGCEKKYDLIAGAGFFAGNGNNGFEGYLAGYVTISHDVDNVYVKYETIDGWLMDGTLHLYVGKNIPDKDAPGLFPYHKELSNATEYTFVIPKEGLDLGEDACLIFAAHAGNLKNPDGGTETGWAKGEILDGGNNNWAQYLGFCLTKCGDPRLTDKACFKKVKLYPNGEEEIAAEGEFKFELFKKNDAGIFVSTDIIVETNELGEVCIEGLDEGLYRFVEIVDGTGMFELSVEYIEFEVILIEEDNAYVHQGWDINLIDDTAVNHWKVGPAFGTVTATNAGNVPLILAGLNPKNGNPYYGDKNNPNTPFVVPNSNHFVFAQATRAEFEEGVDLEFLMGNNYEIVGTGMVKLVDDELVITIDKFYDGLFGAIAFNQIPVVNNGNIHSAKEKDLAKFGAVSGFNHDNNITIPCPAGDTIYLYIHCGTIQFYL